MEFEYEKKDIKKAPKIKKVEIKLDESGKQPRWFFVLNGVEHGFITEESAEAALKRMS